MIKHNLNGSTYPEIEKVTELNLIENKIYKFYSTYLHRWITAEYLGKNSKDGFHDFDIVTKQKYTSSSFIETIHKSKLSYLVREI